MSDIQLYLSPCGLQLEVAGGVVERWRLEGHIYALGDFLTSTKVATGE